MREIIQRFQDKSTEVTYLGHLVPTDHEETTTLQQVFMTVGIMMLGLFGLSYVFAVPGGHHSGMALPLVLWLGVAYGLGRLFYVRRMHRLVRQFAGGSFHIPVAPAY